jgi:hypothetical protein
VKATPLTWTVALFFGCAIVFAGLRKLTDDAPAGVTVAVQVAALALIILALVLFVRHRDAGRGGD